MDQVNLKVSSRTTGKTLDSSLQFVTSHSRTVLEFVCYKSWSKVDSIRVTNHKLESAIRLVFCRFWSPPPLLGDFWFKPRHSIFHYEFKLSYPQTIPLPIAKLEKVILQKSKPVCYTAKDVWRCFYQKTSAATTEKGQNPRSEYFYCSKYDTTQLHAYGCVYVN